MYQMLAQGFSHRLTFNRVSRPWGHSMRIFGWLILLASSTPNYIFIEVSVLKHNLYPCAGFAENYWYLMLFKGFLSNG